MTDLEFSNQLVYMKDMLIRSARRLTNNKADAEDLLQETYLRAFTHRNLFKDSTNLRAWTYTIMRNTFINDYRKKLYQNTIFDNTDTMYFLCQSKDTFDVEPDVILWEKEINTTIKRLNSEYHIPFKMHTQGYKYKEIADILGLRIGTVKSRIFFTRKKLIQMLPGYN